MQDAAAVMQGSIWILTACALILAGRYLLGCHVHA